MWLIGRGGGSELRIYVGVLRKGFGVQWDTARHTRQTNMGGWEVGWLSAARGSPLCFVCDGKCLNDQWRQDVAPPSIKLWLAA
jgi:hypothetical protein